MRFLPPACGLAIAIAAGVAGTGSVAADPPSPPSAGTCATCHAEEARDWSQSLHRTAFSDASFQHGFALEPQAFCRDCHLPTTDGVSCASCHGDGDHPTASGSASCAHCHEFAFAGAPSPPERSSLMQLTMTEHRESAHASQECVVCHMSESHSHRFAVSRNPQFLRNGLSTEVTRKADAIEVTLTPNRVGHAFPTGDMFRQVVLRAEVLDGERVLDQRERTFGRSFKMANGAKHTASDTRLTRATETRFAFGPLASGKDIRVRVLYQRRTAEGPGNLEEEIVLYESTNHAQM